jgi:dTDP-4-amino-4,6-dideoxygalactose transaminase
MPKVLMLIPMYVPFVDFRLHYQNLREEIDQAVQAIFLGGQFIGGDAVAQFESNFSALYSGSHCIGTGNGTDALFVSLKMLDVGVGDEVITPAFSWISSAETISMTGAKPVFVDVDIETYTIDVRQIESKITPCTKGIIAVHLYGQAAHVTEIRNLCGKHNLFLIEDCAQAHLTEENGKLAGTIGDAGAFSFYPTKNLGAFGDAGCILTNNDRLADRMRLFANHGGLGRHEMEGINSRLDSIQAAILSVKCRYISEWTKRRIYLASVYANLLRGVSEIVLPIAGKSTRHTYHLFVIRTEKRDQLKDYLAKHEIQTLIHYPVALPFLLAYKHHGCKKGDFPIAEKCALEVLSLPIYPELSEHQIEYVCKTIKAFFGK